MGKKAVKMYFRVVMLAVTLVVALFTIMALYGGDDVPAKSIFHAMLTLSLPLLIVVNAVLVLLWAFRLRWYVVIPIIALACCWNYSGTLYQWRDLPDAPDDTPLLRVATYNVCRFSKDGTGMIATEIKQHMMQERIDIICLQEYSKGLASTRQTVRHLFLPEYPYATTSEGDLMIFSKHPIKSQGEHKWEDTNSSFQWADIRVKGNKLVRVYNMHLQSTAINSNLKQAADMQVDIQNSMFYDLLAEGYAWGLNLRSGQAIDIANHKRECPHPMIVCGDFNDVPYSFTYNTVKGDLMDGFIQCGSGWGATYKGAKGMMRIDYIMHSESLKGAQYYSQEWEYSDHNPVFMSFVNDL